MENAIKIGEFTDYFTGLVTEVFATQVEKDKVEIMRVTGSEVSKNANVWAQTVEEAAVEMLVGDPDWDSSMVPTDDFRYLLDTPDMIESIYKVMKDRVAEKHAHVNDTVELSGTQMPLLLPGFGRPRFVPEEREKYRGQRVADVIGSFRDDDEEDDRTIILWDEGDPELGDDAATVIGLSDDSYYLSHVFHQCKLPGFIPANEIVLDGSRSIGFPKYYTDHYGEYATWEE